jgi:hypothetical protein
MPHYQRMDLENVVFINNGILLRHKEEWNFVIYKKIDRTGEYHHRQISHSQKAKKITCSLSYVDYRSKTNVVILLEIGHPLRGEHAHGKGRSWLKQYIYLWVNVKMIKFFLICTP